MRLYMQIACVFPLAHVAVPFGVILIVLPPRQASPQLSRAPDRALVLSPFHVVVSKLLVQA